MARKQAGIAPATGQEYLSSAYSDLRYRCSRSNHGTINIGCALGLASRTMTAGPAYSGNPYDFTVEYLRRIFGLIHSLNLGLNDNEF